MVRTQAARRDHRLLLPQATKRSIPPAVRLLIPVERTTAPPAVAPLQRRVEQALKRLVGHPRTQRMARVRRQQMAPTVPPALGRILRHRMGALPIRPVEQTRRTPAATHRHRRIAQEHPIPAAIRRTTEQRIRTGIVAAIRMALKTAHPMVRRNKSRLPAPLSKHGGVRSMPRPLWSTKASVIIRCFRCQNLTLHC